MVAGGVGLQALSSALLNQAYGAYVVVLQAQFGWSKTAFSTAYAIQQMEGGLLGPVQGWLLDRFGPRAVMRTGVVLLGAGFIFFSQVNSLTTFYLCFMLMAIGSGLGGFMSIVTTIVNWFERRRSTALGIMQTGSAIGGLVVPLVAWSITANGWRVTAFGSGVIIIAAGLPLAGIMRHKPEQYGEVPDGLRARDRAGATSSAAVLSEVAFTARQAMRTPAFWLLAMGHSLAMFVVGAVSVHLIAHLTEDLGFTLAGAAGVVSVMTGTLLVGQVTGGLLGDRFSKRLIATIATCGHVLAMLLLARAASLTPVLFAAALQGASHGLRGVQMMPIRADYFGRQSFATIAGFSSLVMMWGMMAGPLISGQIADRTGHYTGAFYVLAGAAAIGALCFALARRPDPPTMPALG
jgi:sugar phosphate permease